MKRIGYFVIMAMLVGAFVSVNIAFAGPKCPCFKAKDMEKLMKKGGSVVNALNDPTQKFVVIDTPEQPWDTEIKGKATQVYFQWAVSDSEDLCWNQEMQLKWKSETYMDQKVMMKVRPMPTGDEDSLECAAILNDFIISVK